MTDEFVILALMERYGWTYQEYEEQPEWIIRNAIAKAHAENEVSKSQAKEHGQ